MADEPTGKVETADEDMQELNPKRSKFQTSIEAQLLYNRLCKVGVGEMIPYPVMSEIAGFDVQTRRGPMDTARRMCEREKIVFGVVFDEGLKRLNDTEIVQTGHGAIDHIRKTARRAHQTGDSTLQGSG